MSALTYGPAAGLPAGYARLSAGTTLWRGHDPRWPPAFFGPLPGRPGTQRFDQLVRPAAPSTSDPGSPVADPPGADSLEASPPNAGPPGTCYLALSLRGVLLERVVRDAPRPSYSLRQLRRGHGLASARVGRDLVLIDLVRTVTTVWGLETAQITAPPVLDPPPGTPPYPRTQALAGRWAAATHPVPVDGILYGSRFGGGWRCVALWDRAAAALAWGPSVPITRRRRRLYAACAALGMHLAP